MSTIEAIKSLELFAFTLEGKLDALSAEKPWNYERKRRELLMDMAAVLGVMVIEGYQPLLRKSISTKLAQLASATKIEEGEFPTGPLFVNMIERLITDMTDSALPGEPSVYQEVLPIPEDSPMVPRGCLCHPDLPDGTPHMVKVQASVLHALQEKQAKLVTGLQVLLNKHRDDHDQASTYVKELLTSWSLK